MNHVNRNLPEIVPTLLSTYLKFPDEQPIVALDFRCLDGSFLHHLTKRHKGNTYLYGVTDHAYDVKVAKDKYHYHKVFQASYKEDGKMSKNVFSLAVVNPMIEYALYNELFNSVDDFVEPDFEKEERQKLLSKMKQDQDFIDFGDEGLSEEEIAKRNKQFEKELQKAIKERRIAFRRALREHERRLLSLRYDHFLLMRATDRLMPGGILVMLTPKELIDQTITTKLVQNYDNIMILRLDDEDYEYYRRCIILARKRKTKAELNKEQAILLAETKLKPYQSIPVIELQTQPLYEVPSQDVDAIEQFRIGPITATEALDLFQRSSLLHTYQETYQQTLMKDDPAAPTPLHKGHIMLLLTSGLLNGYIGKGPNQHLVKGTALKMTKQTMEEDEQGLQTLKEREYYHIAVKYLDRNGKFHQLM